MEFEKFGMKRISYLSISKLKEVRKVMFDTFLYIKTLEKKYDVRQRQNEEFSG